MEKEFAQDPSGWQKHIADGAPGTILSLSDDARTAQLFCYGNWGGKRGTRLREAAAPATEGKEIFMLAIVAFYPGEALMQITAFKIFMNNMGNHRHS